MKISLVYGEHAGRGISIGRLRERLVSGGHEILYAAEKGRSEPFIDAASELVVAAGGDGTVSAAAGPAADRGIPLAILPLGTANNIARSIGIDGSIGDLIDGWESARSVPFDLGVASGDWGERRFFESAGGGLVAAGIAAVQTEAAEEPEEPACKVTAALRRFREILSELQARRWSLTLDGIPLSGDFLLVEVLNVRSIGPNLVLHPGTDPSDGFFTVVTAGEEHRKLLCEYLQHRIEGRVCPLSLPARRARRVDIEAGGRMHLDGSVRSRSTAGTSVRIEPAALQLLASG